ncbi:hypothetical protein [Sphingobium sp. ZW T5_29]|uniref:hypothetical protein n=1 Tax=Sphingobium sp. ZW T5_29 TaxID=3378077 RepID=UPI0038532BD9
MTECTHPKSRGALRCRSCAAKHMATDPDIQRRRREGIQRYHAQPGVKIEYRERQRRMMEKVQADPVEMEKRRERGHWLRANVLTRADVVEKTLSEETRRKRGATISALRMRDIPAALREEYRRLVHSKRIPAAEAKQIILDQFKRQMGAKKATA